MVKNLFGITRDHQAVHDPREVRVSFAKTMIAKSIRAIRVLETASPPVFYLPPADVDLRLLSRSEGNSYCEWKGQATYWTIQVEGHKLKNVGWSYEQPTARFKSSKVIWRSIQRFWTAMWTMSQCALKQVVSTAAGSPTRSSVPTKANLERPIGELTRTAGIDPQ